MRCSARPLTGSVPNVLVSVRHCGSQPWLGTWDFGAYFSHAVGPTVGFRQGQPYLVGLQVVIDSTCTSAKAQDL
jgi:hypothetical protein